jgi:hypothetical protein
MHDEVPQLTEVVDVLAASELLQGARRERKAGTNGRVAGRSVGV